VVASLQITGVDVLLPEVRIRLAGVAGRAAVFVDDTLHSVTKPPGERKRRDNAPDLILRVIIGVVAVRGVMSVGHDAVPDDQQARPYSHKYVVVDIFKRKPRRIPRPTVGGEESDTCCTIPIFSSWHPNDMIVVDGQQLSSATGRSQPAPKSGMPICERRDPLGTTR